MSGTPAMRLADLATRIGAHLKRFEADKNINRNTWNTLFGDDTYYRVSVETAGNRIAISYANRLETQTLTKAQATAYLAWLDAGNAGKHMRFLRLVADHSRTDRQATRPSHAVREGEEVGDWQPIETAPKDGSLILCWSEKWDEPALLRWKTNSRIDRSYFGDPVELDDYDLVDVDPATHWMRIPPPPWLAPKEAAKPCGHSADHCKHWHDWPMAEGQQEPYGDPGDGLGVQGVCCECGKSRWPNA